MTQLIEGLASYFLGLSVGLGGLFVYFHPEYVGEADIKPGTLLLYTTLACLALCVIGMIHIVQAQVRKESSDEAETGSQPGS